MTLEIKETIKVLKKKNWQDKNKQIIEKQIEKIDKILAPYLDRTGKLKQLASNDMKEKEKLYNQAQILKANKDKLLAIDNEEIFKAVLEEMKNRTSQKPIKIFDVFYEFKNFTPQISLLEQFERLVQSNEMIKLIYKFFDTTKQLQTFNKNFQDIDYLLNFRTTKHLQKTEKDIKEVAIQIDNIKKLNREVEKIYQNVYDKFNYYKELIGQIVEFENNFQEKKQRYKAIQNHHSFGEKGECSQQSNCSACTRYQNCVFLEQNQTCVQGDIFGPLDDILTDKFRYGFCEDSNCYLQQSCRSCLLKNNCKWNDQKNICINISREQTGKFTLREDIILCTD